MGGAFRPRSPIARFFSRRREAGSNPTLAEPAFLETNYLKCVLFLVSLVVNGLRMTNLACIMYCIVVFSDAFIVSAPPDPLFFLFGLLRAKKGREF